MDEVVCGIIIKFIGIFLYYKMNEEVMKDYFGEKDGNEYLINLIDLLGYVDFFFEVIVVLCIIDGVLVVIDCVEGVCV